MGGSSSSENLPLLQDEGQDKRTKVFQELIMTEKTYVNGLVAMVEYQKAFTDGGMKPDAVKAVFSISENLRNMHLSFLEELEQGGPDNVGASFLSIVGAMTMYKGYVNNYSTASQTLKDIEGKQAVIGKLFPSGHDGATIGGIPMTYAHLASLLITPIQRLPRYEMLLVELRKRTPKSHADTSSLNKAFEAIQKATSSVNEAARAQENREILLAIDRELGSKCDGLVQPSRRYISRHTLHEVEWRGGKATVHKAGVYLFSDLIVLTRERKARFSNNVEMAYECSLQLSQAYRQGLTTWRWGRGSRDCLATSQNPSNSPDDASNKSRILPRALGGKAGLVDPQTAEDLVHAAISDAGLLPRFALLFLFHPHAHDSKSHTAPQDDTAGGGEQGGRKRKESVSHSLPLILCPQDEAQRVALQAEVKSALDSLREVQHGREKAIKNKGGHKKRCCWW